MRFVSIASGSSGNCVYIGSEHTHILVDAGISNRRMEEGLREIGVDFKELSGICLTHEHSDHIVGLKTALKKHPVPVYGTKETLEKVKECLKGELPAEYLMPIRPDFPFVLGDLEAEPFSVDHDAADPVAYRFNCGGKSAAVVTDLGNYSSYTAAHLQNLSMLLLESNHDIHMLQAGAYPYYLKKRILGDHGHLSNEAAGRLLCELLHDGLKHVLLGHISRDNNYPALAYEAVRLEITMGDNPYQGSDFDIQVASRGEMSGIFSL
ncbi:MAG: MBL fold metallo-hydrolase [Lachnospiraceae bacterium]|nr:MBL fold metallo-hydrolase [Lachnospiraceae bacterium]